MGIQRFYRWLKNHKVNGLFTHFLPKEIDILCVDFNGVLHRAAQEAYAYGDFDNPAKRREIASNFDKNPITAVDKYNKNFLDIMILSLEQMIMKIDPKKYIYIAIDGIAPEAKMYQQRERRYRSAKLREETLNPEDRICFDSNSISPGTEIMNLIDIRMRNWSSTYDNNIKIIYSSHLVIGEGEHKIFDFLRKIEASNVAIHGLDSDLIMLSLLCDKHSIYLLRENFYPRKTTEFVSIDILGEFLNGIMNTTFAKKDFVIFLYLIGNDFVPHMPGLEDRDICIDTMVHIYKNYGKKLHNEDGTINWYTFSGFIAAMAVEESNLLVQLSHTDYKYPLKILEDNIHNDILNYEEFRRLWYTNAFESKGSVSVKFEGSRDNEEDVENMISEMCANYCSMISWMYMYYTNGISSINYNLIYDFYHTPLLYDLAGFLYGNIELKEMWTNIALDPSKTISICPFHQLLYILPPHSANLVPKEFRILMFPGSPIDYYYPLTYQSELQGKRASYEEVIFIPKINIQIIINACNDIASQYNPELIQKLCVNGSDLLYDHTKHIHLTHSTMNKDVIGDGKRRMFYKHP